MQEVIPTVFAEFFGMLFSLLYIGVLKDGNTLEVLIEHAPLEFHTRVGGGFSGSFWLGLDSDFRACRFGFRGLLRLLGIGRTRHAERLR